MISDRVSVIIVNWNGEKYLANCLDALRNQAVKPHSIQLVDDASSDCSIEIVQSGYPEIEIIRLDENLGFATGNNIVLKTVSTKFVALLNNDAGPHPLWLTKLLDALKKHPEAGFAASKMLSYHTPDRIDLVGDVFTTAGTALMRGRGEPSDAYSEREYVFGACAGAALVAIRDATNKGWALGTDRFMERIAAAVSRRVAPLPKGRTRKGRN